MPHSSVWWVSALRSSAQRGVLVEEAVQRVGELVLVALRLRRGSRSASTGSGGVERLDLDRRRRARRARRRCVVSVSLATAAMSPARHLGRPAPAPCPASIVSWCSRSSVMVRPFTSVRVGLHRALQHLEQVHAPDVRVDDRLEHERDRRARRPRVGRRALLDDEVREPVDADELRRAAAQHREHRSPRAMPVASACASSVDVDRLVGEVALHEVVVGDDDALDERVVDRVLLGLHARRGSGPCVPVPSCRRSSDRRCRRAGRSTPRNVGLLADRELAAARRRRRTSSLSCVERARERRPLAVELVDEDRAREAELARPCATPTSVCTSTPSTAETTKIARSAARSAAATSPTKSA